MVQTHEAIQTAAQALIQAAARQQGLPALREEIRASLQVLDHPDLTAAVKPETLQALISQASPVLATYLRDWQENGTSQWLVPIFSEVLKMTEDQAETYEMTVTSVLPLTLSQRQRLTALVSQRLGLKIGQVHQVLDARLLGGFMVEVNHQVIDASVRHQLQVLRQNLK